MGLLYNTIERAIQNCDKFEFHTLDLGEKYEFRNFISVKFFFKSIYSATDAFQSFSNIGRHCQASNGVDITVVIYGKNTEGEVEEFSKLMDAFYDKYPDKVSK